MVVLERERVGERQKGKPLYFFSRLVIIKEVADLKRITERKRSNGIFRRRN